MTAAVSVSKSGPGDPTRFFSFDNLTFRYEPFPIGLARPLMRPELYTELVSTYPEDDLFSYFPKVGHKYSLSEGNNPDGYFTFLRRRPVWGELYRYLKSDAFIVSVMDALRVREIDLGYHGEMPAGRRLVWVARRLVKGRLTLGPARLRTRFEFAMLPVDGGSLFPHTDSLEKIVTLVVSMVNPGEWNPAFGGGTDVNRHRNPASSFNSLNRRAKFEDMEILETYAFQANQAVIFVKTFNSWHSVRPMTGTGSNAMRRSLTINIELDR
jgi:hypothetical protein